MKKSLFLSVLFSLLVFYSAEAQLGGIMRKAQNAVENSILGEPKPESAKPAPEPACACDPATLVFELGGKYDLTFSELGISQQDDGSLLLQSQMGNEYFIVKDGQTKGPYTAEDPEIAKYAGVDPSDPNANAMVVKYKDYISKSGDKLVIKFAGKTYGPYAQINDFVVTKSKDKFLAMVVQDVVFTEDMAKKMQKDADAAKTDQEKMAISMQYSQMMQANMFNSDGKPKDITPKAVTNIEGSTYSLLNTFGGQLNGTAKFDDIVVIAPDKIMDLKGNTLFTLKPGDCSYQDMFINTTNTKYACYNYGTLTFSDGTTLSELFNPRLVKENGKIFLAYMYYSPKKNAVMECKIPF